MKKPMLRIIIAAVCFCLVSALLLVNALRPHDATGGIVSVWLACPGGKLGLPVGNDGGVLGGAVAFQYVAGLQEDGLLPFLAERLIAA